MYQVMMIDDELDILYGAQFILDWSAEGFELSKLCCDSQDALGILRNNPIDLVITDIRMPKIDGLTLVSMIQQEFPDTKVIVLSGYDDFQYAKAAFKAGIIDYLLKPLDATELSTVLQHVREELDNSHMFQNSQDLQANAVLQVKQHKLFNYLLTGYGSLIDDDGISLLSSLDKKQYRILICRSILSRLPGDAEDNSDAIQKLLFLHLNNYFQVCFHILYQDLAVFLLVQETGLPQRLQQLWSEIQSTEIHCALLLSPILESLHALNKTYRDLQKTLEHSIFFGNGSGLYIYKPLFLSSDGVSEWKMDPYRMRLREALLSHDPDALPYYFDCLVNELQFQKDQLSVEQGRIFWRLFSNCCLDTLKDIFHISQEAADEFSYGCVLIKYYLSMGEIAKHILFLVQTALATNHLGVTGDVGITISQICFYLQVHAYEKISLVQIAENFYLNPSYLSRSFREKMGITLWNYVIQLRLTKAKKMLINTNEATKTIAHDCGFQSVKSFFTVFKKNEGCTPGSYRAQQRKNRDAE